MNDNENDHDIVEAELVQMPSSLKQKAFIHKINLNKNNDENNEIEVKSSHGDYLCRDFLMWLIFLILLPMALFTIYYFTTSTTITPTKTGYSNVEIISLKQNLNLDDEQEKPSRPLKRISLKNRSSDAICNDGSYADYYLRMSKQNQSLTWIILLEGGYFCYNSLTCHQRLINSPQLTTSLGNKMFKSEASGANGILSSSKRINKYWSNANVV
jgi:hypothetical protein